MRRCPQSGNNENSNTRIRENQGEKMIQVKQEETHSFIWEAVRASKLKEMEFRALLPYTLSQKVNVEFVGEILIAKRVKGKHKISQGEKKQILNALMVVNKNDTSYQKDDYLE